MKWKHTIVAHSAAYDYSGVKEVYVFGNYDEDYYFSIVITDKFVMMWVKTPNHDLDLIKNLKSVEIAKELARSLYHKSMLGNNSFLKEEHEATI